MANALSTAVLDAAKEKFEKVCERSQRLARKMR